MNKRRYPLKPITQRSYGPLYLTEVQRDQHPDWYGSPGLMREVVTLEASGPTEGDLWGLFGIKLKLVPA